MGLLLLHWEIHLKLPQNPISFLSFFLDSKPRLENLVPYYLPFGFWFRKEMTINGNESCEARPHRPSAAGESDGCFSDAEDGSWHSPHNSNCDNEIDDDGVDEACRESCISECLSSSEIDLECGTQEIKVNLNKADRGDCRICHLSLETRDSGVPIVLGCSCKNDLAAAHSQCAETWFKIKGNKKCEICGSIAKNVVNAGDPEHSNETDSVIVTYAHPTETRNFWQGHRFLSFLLACMVFAFVISWLFHFNVPGWSTGML